MEKKDIFSRFPRRKISKETRTIPDASLSIRTLIDRTAKGLPVNAKLSRHIPLPQDGMILDDFETGTEEILDVTDAVEYVDTIRKQQQYIAEEKEKARQEMMGSVPVVPVPSESPIQ